LATIKTQILGRDGADVPDPATPYWIPLAQPLITGVMTLAGAGLVFGLTMLRDRTTRPLEAAERRRYLWYEFRLKALVELQVCLGKLWLMPNELFNTKYGPAPEDPAARQKPIYEKADTLVRLTVEADLLVARLKDPAFARLVSDFGIDTSTRCTAKTMAELMDNHLAHRDQYRAIERRMAEMFADMEPPADAAVRVGWFDRLKAPFQPALWRGLVARLRASRYDSSSYATA
jgi:hypothetical protein